jgi:predicted nucleotidyltransferase component of viral defense system
MHKEALTKEGTALFPLLRKFDGFYLAGGTALALQIGHRISVDFDLFSPEEISKTLLRKVTQIYGAYPVSPVINNRDELTVLVRDVKMTFLSYPFPAVAPLIEIGELKMLSVGEIGSTKAYSIGRRGTYKDYVDLYFILSGGYATLAEIIHMAEKKFGAEFNSRLFTEQLLFMDDIEDYKIDFLDAQVLPAKIREVFKREIAKLKW